MSNIGPVTVLIENDMLRLRGTLCHKLAPMTTENCEGISISMFSIQVSYIVMGLFNQSCLSGWPAGQTGSWTSGHASVLRGKTLKRWIYAHTLQPSFFIPAILIGAIDFQSRISLSVTLTLAESRQVSSKQNLLVSILSHAFFFFFLLTRMKLFVVLTQTKLNSLILQLSNI